MAEYISQYPGDLVLPGADGKTITPGGTVELTSADLKNEAVKGWVDAKWLLPKSEADKAAALAEKAKADAASEVDAAKAEAEKAKADADAATKRAETAEAEVEKLKADLAAATAPAKK